MWVCMTYVFRRTYARPLDINLIGQTQYDLATSALEQLAIDMLVPCMLIGAMNLLCTIAMAMMVLSRGETPSVMLAHDTSPG